MTRTAGSIRRIKGLSEERRLPRLGKIRLGIKKVAKSGAEYPAEVDYFVCPPEVQAKYGERPKELDVMLPVEDESMVFPQALKWYEASGLRCKGDGEVALRRRENLVVKTKSGAVADDARVRLLSGGADGDPNDLVEIGCAACPLRDPGPGEKNARCGEKASLMVMLYTVNMGGVYQIDTGSVNNIVNLNSTLELVRTMAGRIALVPLKLRRIPQEIQYEGTKSTHYLLSLDMDLSLPELVAYRRDAHLILAKQAGLLLPVPKEDGPDDAPGAIVEPAEPREVENEAAEGPFTEQELADGEDSHPAPPSDDVEQRLDSALSDSKNGPAFELTPPAPEPAKPAAKGTKKSTPVQTSQAANTIAKNVELGREIWKAANAVGMASKDGTVAVPPDMQKEFVIQGMDRRDARWLAEHRQAKEILAAYVELAQGARP